MLRPQVHAVPRQVKRYYICCGPRYTLYHGKSLFAAMPLGEILVRVCVYVFVCVCVTTRYQNHNNTLTILYQHFNTIVIML
jgi:hypothetical protein